MLRPPRRILVPVDLSPASAEAFEAARGMARRSHARLEVVYCDAPLPPEMALFGAPALAWSPRRAQLERELVRRYPGADSHHVLHGEASPTILRLVEERRPDLLVMGSHRRRGLDRLILGSVTASVAGRSIVPVLVIPAGLARRRRGPEKRLAGRRKVSARPRGGAALIEGT